MEEIREELEKMIEVKGIGDKEVIELSQSLDEYIVSYYKELDKIMA